MGDFLAHGIGLIGQNAIGAVVSIVVGFLLRRLIKQLKLDQEETKVLAARAATQSGNAARDAATAGRHAKTATDTSVDTNKAMEWLVTELVAKDDALAESLRAREYLKEKVDTAVATVAYQAAARPVTDPDLFDVGETDDTYATGKHRLPTRIVQTVEQEADR